MPRFIHQAKFIAVITVLLISLNSNAQGIDWSKDTVSKYDATGQRDTYLNKVRGSGQKATEKITLSVAKLKAITDACSAKGINEVSVMVGQIRNSNDAARYRRANPLSTASEAQLIGSQVLIFRVPRSAFAGAAKSGIKKTTNSLFFSLLSMGFAVVDGFGLPDSTEDIYLILGTVCPPPASCD